MGTTLLGKQLIISHNLGNLECHSIGLFAQLLVQPGGIIRLEGMGIIYKDISLTLSNLSNWMRLLILKPFPILWSLIKPSLTSSHYSSGVSRNEHPNSLFVCHFFCIITKTPIGEPEFGNCEAGITDFISNPCNV